MMGLESDRLVEWILEQQLPFDSLYSYGSDRLDGLRGKNQQFIAG
jgi:hypothetical protein